MVNKFDDGKKVKAEGIVKKCLYLFIKYDRFGMNKCCFTISISLNEKGNQALHEKLENTRN